jgi:flagellar basal body-associated protein FliL
MGDLCRLFSRTTELNILIYVLVCLIITVGGGMWVYGKYKAHEEDAEESWETWSYYVLVIGAIVVSMVWAFNMIVYEVSFNRKCNAVEQFIDKQMTQLKSRIDPAKVAEDTSRVFVETLGNQLKSQGGRMLKDYIVNEFKKAIPARASGLSGM